MKAKKIVIGQRFGRLIIIKEVEPRVTRRRKGNVLNTRRVEVKCDCGTTKIVDFMSLRNGLTLSCGCYKRELSHNRKSFVYGVGVNDVDLLIFTNNKHILSYEKWQGMLYRCYNPKSQIKYPTYAGCTVCNQWHKYSNFKRWFDENYNPETMQGWHLDKDILIKGNKVYSPETCCFVPQEINSLFNNKKKERGQYPIGVSYHKATHKFSSNVSINGKYLYLGLFDTPELAFDAYQKRRNKYIKEVADKWKDKIDKKVYDAMYAYKVEITD